MPEQVDQRGPVHDNALRWLAVHDLVTLCRWIGVEADEASVRISESLPATTQYADLVIEVARGELAQVEFVTTVGPDLPVRMHEYRSRLMRREPGCSLTQHVLVLGRGKVPSEHRGLDYWFRLHVTYLRDCDPGTLLASPSLAPLAPLGRVASQKERTSLLRQALEVIRDGEGDEQRRDALVGTAESLARIYLDGITIAGAREERVMPIEIDPDVWDWAMERARESERVVQPVVEVLRPFVDDTETVLRHRFGEHPFTRRLALRVTYADPQSAVKRVLEAESLDELVESYLEFKGS
jgi:hypothetical protein